MLTGRRKTYPRSNLGATRLRRRRRAEDPMRKFDRLPPKLRAWIASAVLPWRPRSVRRAFTRALACTRSETRAPEELDRLQQRLIARDARRVWGKDHPCASSEAEP